MAAPMETDTETKQPSIQPINNSYSRFRAAGCENLEIILARTRQVMLLLRDHQTLGLTIDIAAQTKLLREEIMKNFIALRNVVTKLEAKTTAIPDTQRDDLITKRNALRAEASTVNVDLKATIDALRELQLELLTLTELEQLHLQALPPGIAALRKTTEAKTQPILPVATGSPL